jgi:hypothetical protein
MTTTPIKTVGDLRAALARFPDGAPVRGAWDLNLFDVAGVYRMTADGKAVVIIDVDGGDYREITAGAQFDDGRPPGPYDFDYDPAGGG